MRRFRVGLGALCAAALVGGCTGRGDESQVDASSSANDGTWGTFTLEGSGAFGLFGDSEQQMTYSLSGSFDGASSDIVIATNMAELMATIMEQMDVDPDGWPSGEFANLEWFTAQADRQVTVDDVTYSHLVRKSGEAAWVSSADDLSGMSGLFPGPPSEPETGQQSSEPDTEGDLFEDGPPALELLMSAWGAFGAMGPVGFGGDGLAPIPSEYLDLVHEVWPEESRSELDTPGERRTTIAMPADWEDDELLAEDFVEYESDPEGTQRRVEQINEAFARALSFDLRVVIDAAGRVEDIELSRDDVPAGHGYPECEPLAPLELLAGEMHMHLAFTYPDEHPVIAPPPVDEIRKWGDLTAPQLPLGAPPGLPEGLPSQEELLHPVIPGLEDLSEPEMLRLAETLATSVGEMLRVEVMATVVNIENPNLEPLDRWDGPYPSSDPAAIAAFRDLLAVDDTALVQRYEAAIATQGGMVQIAYDAPMFRTEVIDSLASNMADDAVPEHSSEESSPELDARYDTARQAAVAELSNLSNEELAERYDAYWSEDSEDSEEDERMTLEGCPA